MADDIRAQLEDPVAREMLASRIPARLAYNWSDGTPRVVPIWFHWDGTEVVMGTPPGAPKLKALSTGDRVALTIDSNEWPYKVLQIRGVADVSEHRGVVPEYAAAAERYFGPEGGKEWVAQMPEDVAMWRIAVRPDAVKILDFETRFPSALSG
ncbi:MAG TPA: pyridoxamine 5'-phosphate oxidase family protein [Actinomycetota bacterium]|nr:pyridoxamine 5'-phosphate oxidase family protein [Actinomycetota bacterium]